MQVLIEPENIEIDVEMLENAMESFSPIIIIDDSGDILNVDSQEELNTYLEEKDIRYTIFKTKKHGY